MAFELNKSLLQNTVSPLRAVFIVNPFSGVGQKKYLDQKLHRLLDHQKFSYELRFTEGPGHATQIAQQLVDEGADIVVAVGGDGSVNEVATALIGTETVLGILPAGSGNGLAMHLGLGRNIDRAISMLNTSSILQMDTCLLNDRPFFNVAGIGFDARIAYLTKQNKQRGFWGYFKSVLKESTAYRAYTYDIVLDGKAMSRQCLIIAIANAPMYGYNFQIAPLAKLNDGLLEVMLIRHAPVWQHIGSAWKSYRGSLHNSKLVERYQAKEVKIDLPEELAVHVDGEGFLAGKKLHFKINPLSLRVMVP